MTEAMKALDEIEAALKSGQRVMAMLTEHGPGIVPHLMDTDDNAGEYFRQCTSAALSLLPTLRAALTPPADGEVEAIRARHEAWEESTISVGSHAHTDRATLLRALDAERERRVEVEGALKLFMSAATPVSTDIDPRGYAWSLAYLDQARATLTKD